MMKKLFGLLALAAMSTVAFANVDLRNNIRDVYHRGSCEEAGAITMSVNGNDFKNATTTNPVFIRVRLDHQAVLCQTLVDDCDDPIYLAMRLEEFTGGGVDQLLAPAETVSIVRWQEGEPDIWLRVQSSSETWIDRGGSITHPSDNRSVAWTFGITARSSWESNVGFFGAGISNLPSNTLDPASPDQFDAASTLVCTDLTGSDLATTGVESTLNYDIISFTDTDNSGGSNSVCGASTYSIIDVGRQEDINFSDDRTIARGIDVECDWSIVGKQGYPCAVLCFDSNPIDQNTVSIFGLTWITNCLDIRVDCDYGWHNGSYVHVEQAASDVGEDWGFLYTGDYSAAPFSNPYYAVGGSGFTGTDAVFSSGFSNYGDGVIVRDWVDLVWQGSGSLGVRDLTICLSIGTHYQRSANDVNLAVNPVVTNRDTMFDTAPYDEAWQFAFCPPSEITLSQLDWAFGCFLDPTADPVTIFFPYVPKIINDDGSETGFWSGFAISNHGRHDYADGETWVSSYLADGTHFTAGLEAIGTRQMQVYLLQNGDSGIGLYRVDCGLNTYTAMVPDDGTSTFGTKRSTMFVWGQHTAADCTSANTTGGDLDGYMLIGQDALINGGYLARNYDDDSTDQNTDMPVSLGKRSLRNKQNSPVQIIKVQKRDEKVNIYR